MHGPFLQSRQRSGQWAADPVGGRRGRRVVSSRQLYDLQQIETQVQQRQRSRKGIVEKLADTMALQAAQQQAVATRKALDTARADLKDAELLSQQIAKKIKDADNQLYSGRTSNTKELVNLQSDLKMLKRQVKEAENQVIEMMAKVEQAEKAAAAAQVKAEVMEQDRAKQKVVLTQEQGQLTQEIANLERDAAQAKTGLPPQTLGLYQTIKTARGGVAVSAMSGGLCRACGMQLPSHVLQKVRADKELVRCTSCGRILFAA
ncbi:MAG: hypothetical protein EXR67_03435 [Dehalococcoidia bacterium]|nr:hypothetical protein [Dehalococcoidia bacterium]